MLIGKWVLKDIPEAVHVAVAENESISGQSAHACWKEYWKASPARAVLLARHIGHAVERLSPREVCAAAGAQANAAASAVHIIIRGCFHNICKSTGLVYFV